MEETTEMETRIIEAAKRVFIRKGYEAATMSDIAREAGIGRTALHYYYRTKERLFEAVFGRLISTLLPNIDRIMDEDKGMLEKLPAIIGQYIDLVRANPLFPLFVVNELNRDPGHLYRTILKDPGRLQPILRMRKQMEEEMEKGLLRKIPIEDVVATLVSLVVFPLLVHRPLTDIFMEGNRETFEAFLLRRRLTVVEILTRMLAPQGRALEGHTLPDHGFRDHAFQDPVLPDDAPQGGMLEN